MSFFPLLIPTHLPAPTCSTRSSAVVRMAEPDSDAGEGVGAIRTHDHRAAISKTPKQHTWVL
ncbi:hypothetical protein GLOTRDRAFT_134138 [Gloeophyllum trabeum ATCC 11539]|uniref:Uncharacterized protein n=1 Tax=Gloeophyllum trabeum (strain ATCC 11539 / FP-39264 / Madison 617) TaxID=670483 RepID=S7PS75_GLOTA|nr:uncharacterized protein GLOTRDRAFT_134138 [Gloeophyllum trabeum ATCC 11539]EPQ50232.1 hypothetical protein GLOTRDRAFT_134138 [Gloeophyllum trabeum ATCC 11539]